jgi:hypothetical protein
MRLHGATFVTLSHPSKASKLDGSMLSGSTAFRAAVRSVISIEYEDDKQRDNRRRLKRIKAQYVADDQQGERLRFVDGLFRPLDDQEVQASADAVRDAVVSAVGALLDKGERVTKETSRGDSISLREVVSDINKERGAGFANLNDAKRFMREARGFSYREGYGKTKASYYRLEDDEIF